MKAEERRRPLDHELVERPQHPPARMLAVGAVDDELRDHRVVDARHLVARGDAGVDAYARPRRLPVRRHEPRRGEKPVRDVFRVDPAFDRVAAQLHVVLGERERLPERDANLLAHEVDARHLLGDRVLDLDAGVHLHEVVGAVRVRSPSIVPADR